MELRIPRDIAEQHTKFFTASPWELKLDSYRWNDYFEIDLTEADDADLAKLRATLNGGTDRHTKKLLRDITAWEELRAAEGQRDKLPTAKNMKMAAMILAAYIDTSVRKHIYAREGDSDRSALLSYYVSSVDYHEPDRRNEVPARVSATLHYEQFGESHTDSISWHAGDCIHKTAPVMLSVKGYSLEVPALRRDHLIHIDQYDDFLNDIGGQYLATGIGDMSGIDGNDDDDDHSWRHWSHDTINMNDTEGNPSRVVIDLFRESDKTSSHRATNGASGLFWTRRKLGKDVDEDIDYGEEGVFEPEVPIHPYVVVFHLRKHKRLAVHIQNLTKYEYNTAVRDSLVLPARDEGLLDVLLADTKARFADVITGKTGGIVVLCQGPPGTGKTLTAEVYAEALERPLYTVQCSQLGIDSDTLEKNLIKTFSRASRWGAVLLLDEADVYVHERGNDLIQNAIVGVFLRVMEYYDGVMFMTTNRGDLVDDAVLSRCTARIPYDVPPVADQRRIWAVLARANDAKLPDAVLDAIVAVHNDLSGRDIKNLLKLCLTVRRHSGREIDAAMVSEMREFKPTVSHFKNKATK